jgi:hypothetical protein
MMDGSESRSRPGPLYFSAVLLTPEIPPVDQLISALQRSIFREKVCRAAVTPPEDRIAESAALFDDAVTLMRDAIATQHPDYAPERVQQEVLRRLRIARRVDGAGIYQAAGWIDDEP